MIRCAERDGVEGEVINLGTGVEISVGEIAAPDLRLTGTRVPGRGRRSACVPRTAKSSDSSPTEEGRRACSAGRRKCRFDEGLRRTVEWFRGAVDSYKASIYNV